MKEVNDCTVMAWCNTFDAPYTASHAWMAKHGRRHKKGMTLAQVKAAINSCKKARFRFGPYSRSNRITLSRFCKEHPVGRYYICVAGHALCVKDGVIYDHSHSPRRQVTFAARIYLEGDL